MKFLKNKNKNKNPEKSNPEQIKKKPHYFTTRHIYKRHDIKRQNESPTGCLDFEMAWSDTSKQNTRYKLEKSKWINKEK